MPAAAGSLVLLVDDQPDVRDVLAAFLEDEGWSVVAAGTFAEARELVSRLGNAIRIVVCDVHLPDAHGRDLARSAREEIPGLPVLFLSGDVGELAELRSEFDTLAKPFDPEVLVERVASIVPG